MYAVAIKYSESEREVRFNPKKEELPTGVEMKELHLTPYEVQKIVECASNRVQDLLRKMI